MLRFQTLLLLAVLGLSGRAMAWSEPRMIQCESCATPQQMQVAATQRGTGSRYVFSLANRVIMKWEVEYDGETRTTLVVPSAVEPAVEDAFALMLNAEALDPQVLSGQQIIVGDIDAIGGGSHDPVEISINGEHDDSYGSFMQNATSCLGDEVCATRVNPAFGNVVAADWRLATLGISILRGVGITWEKLPPVYDIWLCNANRDCALIRLKDGRWEYVESRAEGGSGKRYPKYGEGELTYNFDNTGEAAIFERGLEGGGASVLGAMTLQLVCGTADGNLQCYYAPGSNW